MKPPFLVKCTKDIYYYPVKELDDPCLTKNKVYLVYDVVGGLYYIKDDLGRCSGWIYTRFKKPEFIDIWEFKRNEEK